MEFSFKVSTHQEYGMRGLCPAWMRDADPLTGMAAAHDMLEHFRKEPGPVEGEFMALGAALWIRGDGGYWSNKGNSNSPGQHVGSDLPDILQRVRSGQQHCSIPGRTASLDQYAEGEITTALDSASREMRDRDEDGLTDEERRTIRAYMRTGYRRAVKRYAVHNACSVAFFFQQLEEAADKKIKHCEEGDKVIFRLDLARLQFRCVDVQPYDENF